MTALGYYSGQLESRRPHSDAVHYRGQPGGGWRGHGPRAAILVRPPGRREENQKQENLETALDKIREKFGRESVSFGSVIHNDLGIRDHKKEL